MGLIISQVYLLKLGPRSVIGKTVKIITHLRKVFREIILIISSLLVNRNRFMHIQAKRETLNYAASAKYYTYDYSIETAKFSLLPELGPCRRFARGTLSQCLSNSARRRKSCNI